MARRICRRQPPAVGILMLLFFILALYQMHVANERGIEQEGVVGSLISDSKVNLAVLPKEYEESKTQPQHCADLFGRNYLDYFRRTTADYCEVESPSHLTCFHNNVDPEIARIDSFCIGGPASFISPLQKFDLHCKLRSVSGKEVKFGIPTIEELTKYSYNQGPQYVLGKYIGFSDDEDRADMSKQSSAPIGILVKRHPNPDVWHSLLDIMSTYLTLDVLRIAHNPDTTTSTKSPYFSHADFHNTQIVFLDDLDDGPYSWLWSLFARKPILRLSNLTAASTSTNIPLFKSIIAPLPGLSNSLNAIDETVTDCRSSPLLHAFTNRVLTAFNIPIQSPNSIPNSPSAVQKNNPISLTFIAPSANISNTATQDDTRQLANAEALLNSLMNIYDRSILTIKTTSYADLTFNTQLNITHADTDILLGVHGPHLTHAMFLRPGSAVVEIYPYDLEPRSERYRNLVNLLDEVTYRRIKSQKSTTHHNDNDNNDGGFESDNKGQTRRDVTRQIYNDKDEKDDNDKVDIDLDTLADEEIHISQTTFLEQMLSIIDEMALARGLI